MDAYLASLFQILIGAFIIFIYGRYFYNKNVVKFGTLFLFFIFLLGDAFPYIIFGWGKKGGAIIILNLHIHHSFLGIIGIISFLFYYYKIPKEYKEKYLFMLKIDDIFNFILWISTLCFISQLHEIFYFNNLFFPDRSFPIQIIL